MANEGEAIAKAIEQLIDLKVKDALSEKDRPNDVHHDSDRDTAQVVKHMLARLIDEALKSR